MNIEYSFKGKKYQSLINYSDEGIAKDEQYFITILPDEPNIINFENELVPECLKNTSPPSEGWKHMPNCHEN